MLAFLHFALSLAATAVAIVLPDMAKGSGVLLDAQQHSILVPPPPGFNITKLGLNGSGCPIGSAFYTLNAARTAVTITFSEYIASAGPGILPTQNRKNCQVTLTVRVPQGYSFAIVDVDYRGFYQLDPKVNAYHEAMYYFQGELLQADAATMITGPVSGATYVYRDTFDLTPTVFSPCGRESVLNINSAIRVDNSGNRTGSGLIANDSLDASINHVFHLTWIECNEALD